MKKKFSVVKDIYATRKIVKKWKWETFYDIKLGLFKKNTEKENEILPAVDFSSPGAVKENNIVWLKIVKWSLNETILEIYKDMKVVEESYEWTQISRDHFDEFPGKRKYYENRNAS